MKFDSITVQERPGGQIKAHGTDEVGAFIFEGRFGVDQPLLRFVKKYVGKHSIFYEAQFNSQNGEINGHWGFGPGGNDGKFRMKKF